MKTSKGFTIIELLVVIAIIAVLAGIVLVNVTSYINKGKDAAIKGNLATIMTNGAVFFDDTTKGNGTYTAFCADAGYTIPAAAITATGVTPTCTIASGSAAYCACAPLKATSGTVFCIDSTGAKEETVSSTCAMQCPVAGFCQ
ncbi:prepilin-type N-terminal cleavage/methylation domain-containing protein [Patescibacteria group bacterium]|nr:prepilin-type N-terminal cleavage/methylation domain-containing protein [Patescibacteria group bacterium]